MPHDDYDHLRESADEGAHFRQAHPITDWGGDVERMSPEHRALLDLEPMRFDSSGTLAPPKGYVEEWADYEDRVHRDRMRQRITIVALVGFLTLIAILATYLVRYGV